ncbi:MAG: hypothetical protein ACRDY3_09880 [Acidimicrobiales bacterium]
MLQLYCSSTDEEILVFASLHAVDGHGAERELSRAWLRGSHHQVAEGTPPYAPHHPHDRRQPLVPGRGDAPRDRVQRGERPAPSR